MFINSNYAPLEYLAITAPAMLVSGRHLSGNLKPPESDVTMPQQPDTTLHEKIVLLLLNFIGDLGTIIASMAIVISFKAYLQTRFSKPGYYLLTFTASNLAVLILLLLYYHFYMTYGGILTQHLYTAIQ